MKIDLFNLAFSRNCYYVLTKSIVEKITFNNRTFYSKFEKISFPINPILLKQHLENEITLAVSLIQQDAIDYIVIEYQQNDWQSFYALVKHLLKSLNNKEFESYRHPSKGLLQIYLPRTKMNIEDAYKEVEHIKHFLELKSNKSYKIYPNQNLPKNFNIITLPTQKI